MKRIITALVFCAAATATAQDATLLGQKEVVSGQAYWGPSVARTLYITGNKYLRDSSGTPVELDTTRNSVGGAGACTETIVMRTTSGATPSSHISIQYRGRATNTSADSVRMYIATRYRVPAGVDTGWVLTSYVYGNEIVPSGHVRGDFATTYGNPVRVNLWAEGQDLRICWARASSGGPGNSDTVAITSVWPRGW
jgi:hypothetical protein